MKTLMVTCSDAQARTLETFIKFGSNCREDDDPVMRVVEVDIEKYARMLVQDWVRQKSETLQQRAIYTSMNEGGR